jgi:hypothetical protein
MRRVIPSLAVGFLLLGSAASVSAAVTAPHADTARGDTATKPQAAPPPASAADNAAAAKHAKRTACLKEAKAKKLVGAQKASYIKDCMNY